MHPRDAVEHRDAIGRKARFAGAAHRWWRVRCNDPDCTAVMLVNETEVLIEGAASTVDATSANEARETIR
jgi:hypothetical protein